MRIPMGLDYLVAHKNEKMKISTSGWMHDGTSVLLIRSEKYFLQSEKRTMSSPNTCLNFNISPAVYSFNSFNGLLPPRRHTCGHEIEQGSPHSLGKHNLCVVPLAPVHIIAAIRASNALYKPHLAQG